MDQKNYFEQMLKKGYENYYDCSQKTSNKNGINPHRSFLSVSTIILARSEALISFSCSISFLTFLDFGIQ